MDVWEARRLWDRFHTLSATVWRSQDTGSAEYRELMGLIPVSDWSADIPEADRSDARKMMAHAERALQRATGFRY